MKKIVIQVNFSSNPSYSIDRVWQIVINKEGTRFYSCSHDKSIKIWNLENKSHLKTYQNSHDSYIYCLCLTKEDKILISGSSDKSIKGWNIEKDNLTLIFTIKDAHKGTLFQ